MRIPLLLSCLGADLGLGLGAGSSSGSLEDDHDEGLIELAVGVGGADPDCVVAFLDCLFIIDFECVAIEADSFGEVVGVVLDGSLGIFAVELVGLREGDSGADFEFEGG